MTNQPETKPLINFDLAEEVPDHVGFLNVCITNDSTGGNSEETYLTLNTEGFGGAGIYVKIDGETVEAGEVRIKLYGTMEFTALLQGMEGFFAEGQKFPSKEHLDLAVCEFHEATGFAFSKSAGESLCATSARTHSWHAAAACRSTPVDCFAATFPPKILSRALS